MIKNGLIKIAKILLITTILFTMFLGTGTNIVQAANTHDYKIVKVNDGGKYLGSYTTVNIEKGKTQKFRFFDGTKSLKATNWTIGTKQVAEITSINKNNGIAVVKGIKEGTTFLKCKYAGQEKTIIIKVLDNGKTTYKIYPTTNNIKVNETKTYELKEDNKTSICTWGVSNPKVLDLKIKQGKAEVTGLKEGTSTLTAYRKWKSKSKHNNNC